MPHVWEMAGMERRYSVPPSVISEPLGRAHPTEDLHAWSIYRQNLNSDFTDSALGSQEKSPLPYGNFQLRESTVHSILSHPRYGPNSRGVNNELGANMFTYLKFGLPRVFPPTRGIRDGSSGYDSSDDGVSDREGRFPRSRSDPDFRNNLIRRQETSSEVAWWRDRRTRSSSEANLLNQDMYFRNEEEVSRNDIRAPSRRTVTASKADSQISVSSHLSRPHIGVFGGVLHTDGLYGRDTHLLNEHFFPKDTALYIGQGVDSDRVVLKYPHIQVRGLTYEEIYKLPGKFGSEKRWLRIFEGLSFEVRGGELLGVMATSEYEGTTLLNVLSYSHLPKRYRLRGDIIVNGTRVTLRTLKDRIAYVQQDCSFAEDMSVRQTLLFTSLLQEPGNQSRTFDTKGRINALIEDLGLGLVKHTRIKNLTMSEKRRLNVACRLLLDTDIVLLDQPTKGMDIFDTFFLVEYLRQWASRGRVVVTTFQPPTYEIFTMLTKVALLSTGRLMYFGKRREMLPYFAFIEYPCPAYKNPADYYLDLVTLDNLSPEAMLESSQRVDLLAETFRRRQEILSDPGPPGSLPGKIKRSNVIVKMLALWIRALIYMFPYNLIIFSRNVAVAATMSVLIGAIFYNVRLGREQEHVQDRLAFHFVMMSVSIWPLILSTVTEVWLFKDIVTKDVSDGLYGKGTYIVTKMQYSFPAATGIFLAYLIPAYCMAGLKNEVDNVTFSVYIGYMLLYLFSVRAVAIAMACTFNSRHLAASVAGFVMSFVALCSGWPVHLQDLSVLWYWLQWVSPMRWIMEQLVLWDLYRTTTRNVTFICSHNPTVVQEQAQGERTAAQPRIVVRAECGLLNGAQAVSFMAYNEDWTPHIPVLITCGFWLFWQLWTILAFVYHLQTKKKSRNRVLRTFQ